MKNKNPIISIVLAVRNEEKYIEPCLQSCKKQSLKREKFEIIIVDGLSTDKTMKLVKNFQSKNPDVQIRILKNSKKIQAAGWNIGFRESQAEYVVMLGGHTILDKEFLQKNIDGHHKLNVPGTGGLVKAKGIDNKNKAIALAFNTRFGAGNAKYWFGNQQEYVETIAFGMYKREVVEQVGYMDEKIVRGQDWELNYRITEKFGKFLFSPAIKSYYHARSTFFGLFKRQFWAGAWKIFIIKKHLRSTLFRHIIPPLFILTLFLSLILGITLKSVLFFYLILFIYLLTDLYFSTRIALKTSLNYLPNLILSYLIIHFAYGLGFWYGLFKFGIKKYE